ncbi:MAG: exodeoxyribonuclease VII small subunit [Sphingopyxis sp.]
MSKRVALTVGNTAVDWLDQSLSCSHNSVMSDAVTPDLSTLTFEAALEELGHIVRQLEEGAVPLDAAISLYERATLLKGHCDARLRDAEARIERIKLSADGKAQGVAPFDGS